VDLVPSGEEAVEADLAKAQENPIPSSPEMLKRGKAVYLRACAVCHGEEGDGKGPLAAQLNPKPRDFTTGLFKFRTTPSSSLPTDFDIFRTITNGVLGTSMLAWSSLPYEDRWSLVHFIKTFSDEFTEEEPEEPIDISDPPARTPELVERGKKVYAEVECNSCHGDTGGGDGPSASDLKDEWGNPIRPFNFKSGLPPKGGSTPKDVYRALMTGLQGTPMPDFGEVFEEKEMAWAVVYYVLSLGEKKRGVGFGVKGDVRFHREPGGPGIPPATFPHWVHRIRFKCSACHPALFEMKAGANKVSMDAILKGKFCGACHNGKVAWISSFETCTRCHVAAQ
ncbi:MAG: c(7)-type cytochrome triheme domain-containing protein, partial [Nitrospinota bacterium]